MKMKSSFYSLICFISITAVLIVSGCGAPHGDKVNESNNPKGSLFDYLDAYGDEEEGYAAYSYVLARSNNPEDEASQKYFELVKAITSSTVAADSLREIINIAKYNLFLIPAKENSGYEPDLALSKSLLLAFAEISPDQFSKPGPYIITIDKPIRFDYEFDEVDMLVADLTNLHPEAIPELVREYKSQVINNDIQGIEKLSSFKISLLNGALLLEENLAFAKVAYSSFKSFFTSE